MSITPAPSATGGRHAFPVLLDTALSPEERAVVRGIGGEFPEDPALDWEQVVQLGRRHGVSPLLYRAWRSREELPARVRLDLQHSWVQAAAMGRAGIEQRDEVGALLAAAGVRNIALKGAALGALWYGDIAWRPFRDLDVLVDPADLARARDALRAAGYRHVGPELRNHHHDVALAHPGGRFWVELHTRLTNLRVAPALTFADMYARSMPAAGGAPETRALGPEDALFHLILHAITDLEGTGAWSLRQFADIAAHLRAVSVDWQDVRLLLGRVGLRRAANGVLGLAAVLADAEVPDDLLAWDLASAALRAGSARRRTLPAMQNMVVLAGHFWREVRRLGTTHRDNRRRLLLVQMQRAIRKGRALRRRGKVDAAGAERWQAEIDLVRQRNETRRLLRAMLPNDRGE